MPDLLPAGWSLPARRLSTEVIDERYRQLKRWGEQHHDDGTSGALYNYQREYYQVKNDALAGDGGDPSWADILLEEVYEALAEEDLANLREELVQCAAVIFAWLEDIDSRKSDPQHQSQQSSKSSVQAA